MVLSLRSTAFPLSYMLSFMYSQISLNISRYPPSAFITYPFLNKSRADEMVHLYAPCRRYYIHLDLWFLVSQQSQRWSWWSRSCLLITSTQGQVLSSTQVEIIAIMNAVDFAVSNYLGRLIFLYSDSLISLSQIPSLFPIPSSSFSMLSGESANSLPSRSSMFLATQVYGKTKRLRNSVRNFYSPPTLDLKTDISEWTWCGRTFRANPRHIPGFLENSHLRQIQPSPEPQVLFPLCSRCCSKEDIPKIIECDSGSVRILPPAAATVISNLQSICGHVKASRLHSLVSTKSSAKTSNSTSFVIA